MPSGKITSFTEKFFTYYGTSYKVARVENGFVHLEKTDVSLKISYLGFFTYLHKRHPSTVEECLNWFGDIPVLSIRQPWAYLISYNIKNIENRSRNTNHRGPFFIHASKTVEKPTDRLLENLGGLLKLPDSYETGGIIGLSSVRKVTENHSSIWAEENQMHYVLGESCPLEFYPLKGQLGFFKIKR